MIRFASILVFLMAAAVTTAAAVDPPLCATFSIVAHDTTTGEFGVGVQSHWFSVGTVVPWAEAGVGAVATQSFAEPAYGPKILARVGLGQSCTTALVEEIAADSLRDLRQVLVIDARGNTGAHTGEGCIPYAGHHVARDHACGGNLLASPTVWKRMSETFTQTAGTLAERIVAALAAGQEAGGDARGMQSAALLVVELRDPDAPWRNRTIDLRVDDHPEPIVELQRLLTIHRAYALADEGDGALAKKDYAEARRLYDAALGLVPQNDELLFWRGSMKMATGDTDGAVDDVRKAIGMNPRWNELLRRIPEAVFPGVDLLCKDLEIKRVR